MWFSHGVLPVVEPNASWQYELPSPGAGTSGLRLFRFLGSLLPVWYRVLLLASGLLILIPFALFEEQQWSVGVFLGFSAPLVFAVIISPILRLRYAADVVRRATLGSEELVLETFAEDYRWPIAEIEALEVDDTAVSLHWWRIASPSGEYRFRVWVPETSDVSVHQYERFIEELRTQLRERNSGKKKA